MLCTITQVLSHPCSTSRWRLWPIMRSFLFPPSPHCPHHDPFHPSCICYNFPCPIYPTYLTWLSMPKCIGKTLMTIPFSSISLHVCSCIETLPRNRFCVTIWHYCLVLLFLALWLVLYEAATRNFSYSSLSIPPRYGRMPLWRFFSHSWMHPYTSIVTGNLHLAAKSIAIHTPHFFYSRRCSLAFSLFYWMFIALGDAPLSFLPFLSFFFSRAFFLSPLHRKARYPDELLWSCYISTIIYYIFSVLLKSCDATSDWFLSHEDSRRVYWSSIIESIIHGACNSTEIDEFVSLE